MSGVLALVGGAEFQPGNEPHDRLLAAAAADGPAFVVTTAAARQDPSRAAQTARAWFAGMGVDVQPLPVHTARDAASPALAALAAGARLLYLCGGDPGLVVRTLRGSVVWAAMHRAWLDGASLAGSSAGAMALCRCALLRASWPDRSTRRPVDALDVVDVAAFLPHHDTFGSGWEESARRALGDSALLLGVDERTAVVWDGDEWRVTGAGRATLSGGGGLDVVPAGGVVERLPRPRGA